MKPALALSDGLPDGAMAKLMSHREAIGRIWTYDLYDLAALDLNTYGSLLVSMHVDQRFLAVAPNKSKLPARRRHSHCQRPSSLSVSFRA